MGNHRKLSKLWRTSYATIPPEETPHRENGLHHRGHNQLTEDDGEILFAALVVAEILAATGHHAGLAGAHVESYAKLNG